jgi:hypothetical protein
MALHIDHIEWGRRTRQSQGSYTSVIKVSSKLPESSMKFNEIEKQHLISYLYISLSVYYRPLLPPFPRGNFYRENILICGINVCLEYYESQAEFPQLPDRMFSMVFRGNFCA